MTEVYKYEPHSFAAFKGFPYRLCSRCGLLALKNELTDWCIKHGCNYADRSDYKSACKQLGKPKDE